VKDVEGFYAYLRRKFPGADVKASTFDAFFDIANEPAVKKLLPVVTKEIEDGWIYGVASDPLKNSQFRAASRLRLACVEGGECDTASAAMRAADRLLVKVPEHTWGVAMAWFLPDFMNYSNVDFDTVLNSRRHFVKDNRKTADYNTTQESWVEQRTYVTNVPGLLREAHPVLAESMEAEFATLKAAKPASSAGFAKVASPVGKAFDCAGFTLAFAGSGALQRLSAGAKEWASANATLGEFSYRTFINEDYNVRSHQDLCCEFLKPSLLFILQ